MRLTFHGAAGEVTGSMHLVETEGRRILLDCGLFQGHREEARRKNLAFPLEPDAVDAIVLSHAHIDHAGRLPILIKRGWNGPIYCTAATRDLSAIMLPDAGYIQEKDHAFLMKRGRDGLSEPLYTVDDATRVVERMIGIPYDRRVPVCEGVHVTFTEAGHILGSAAVVLDIVERGVTRRLVFSGDIGRPGLPIIRDPKPPAGPPADVLIVESTYAGRTHETVAQADQLLMKHVNAVAKRGGKIFIPAFAVGRTQEILYALHELLRDKRIPEVPVFVDSPLAVNATDVFRLHPEAFDQHEQLVGEVSDIFQFRMVKYVRAVEESKRLNTMRGPAIIVAASGMAESGRILHHLRHGLGDHRNMVLMVGFQGASTLGRRLQDGQDPVRIFGDEVPVRAEIEKIAGFSAHGDHDELRAWLNGLGAVPKRAFVVHGEDGLEPMAGLLREVGVTQVDIPRLGQAFDA